MSRATLDLIDALLDVLITSRWQRTQRRLIRRTRRVGNGFQTEWR